MKRNCCQRVTEVLSDLVEGRFGLLERFRIRLHLWRCPTCVRYYRQFKQVYRATGEAEPPQLPGDFEQVMARALERWLNDEPPAPRR